MSSDDEFVGDVCISQMPPQWSPSPKLNPVQALADAFAAGATTSDLRSSLGPGPMDVDSDSKMIYSSISRLLQGRGLRRKSSSSLSDEGADRHRTMELDLTFLNSPESEQSDKEEKEDFSAMPSASVSLNSSQPASPVAAVTMEITSSKRFTISTEKSFRKIGLHQHKITDCMGSQALPVPLQLLSPVKHKAVLKKRRKRLIASSDDDDICRDKRKRIVQSSKHDAIPVVAREPSSRPVRPLPCCPVLPASPLLPVLPAPPALPVLPAASTLLPVLPAPPVLPVRASVPAPTVALAAAPVLVPSPQLAPSPSSVSAPASGLTAASDAGHEASANIGFTRGSSGLARRAGLGVGPRLGTAKFRSNESIQLKTASSQKLARDAVDATARQPALDNCGQVVVKRRRITSNRDARGAFSAHSTSTRSRIWRIRSKMPEALIFKCVVDLS